MDLSEGIRRMGFRRWYERQLVESHAYLVTGLLAMILVLGSLESLSVRGPGWEPLILLGLVLLAGSLTTWSVYRYLTVLLYAEHVGEHSTCGQCRTYGLLEVTRAKAPLGNIKGAQPALGVRCRKCGNEWTIE
jgi:hypothetical protein